MSRAIDNIGRTYWELAGFLEKKRRRNLPLVATSIERVADDVIVLKYHATDVVMFFLNGDIRLNSGGWKTMKTRARMNGVLPFGIDVIQKNHDWWIVVHDLEDGMGVQTYEFYDGWTFHVPSWKVVTQKELV